MWWGVYIMCTLHVVGGCGWGGEAGGEAFCFWWGGGGRGGRGLSGGGGWWVGGGGGGVVYSEIFGSPVKH